MNTKQNILFLLTSSFPFGKEEPLIIYELQKLALKYNSIIIFSLEEKNKICYELPNNVKYFHYLEQKNFLLRILSMRYVFSKFVRQEIKNLKKLEIVLSWNILKVILISYQKATLFDKFFIKFITTHQLKKQKITLYSYWCKDWTLGMSLLKIKNKDYKIVSRMHGYDLYFERHQPPYLPFRHLIFEQLDTLFFISEQGKQYIEKKFNTTFKNHFVSKLGVKNDYKMILKKPSELLTIVSCSHLIPLKRIHLIIEALALIDFPVLWNHFGEGELLEDLQKLAKEKLSNNISYHFCGFTDNDKILKFYHQNPVDLFINVSETEGIPISIMEAFSSGIPAIATNVGGVSELVNNNNGFLVDKDIKSEELAKIICKFYTLPENQIKELRKSAYEKWKNEFNSENNLKLLMQNILN